MTTITEPATLFWTFWGLVVLSIVLYVVSRWSKWERLDYLRAAIPAVAFAAWTMLQRATAFDAVWPRLAEAPRNVAALFVAAVLGVVAASLASKADKKPQPVKK